MYLVEIMCLLLFPDEMMSILSIGKDIVEHVRTTNDKW